MSVEKLAQDYLERAEIVIDTDEGFRADNPDMTVREYAIDLVNGDIKCAIHTNQREWEKELRIILRYLTKEGV